MSSKQKVTIIEEKVTSNEQKFSLVNNYTQKHFF